MSKRPKHILEYMFFQGIGFLVRLLPLKYVHHAGSVVARMFYPLLTSRKKVALRNLRNAYPEMDESWRAQIAFRSFQSVCTTFLELLWFPNFTREIIRQRVRVENPELLDQLRKKNNGIIFLTAHFGSWELAIQAVSVYTGIAVCTIAKTQSNHLVDDKINQWREMLGLKIVPMGVSVREILRTLQQKGIVALAADQSAAKESVAVEFFGRDVPTFQGPAVFSLKTGAPIILGCTLRQTDGSYTMRFILVPGDDLQDASAENVLELTRRQVKATEEVIRKNPEQWMWMHKRWKHVPDRVEIV